MKNDFDKEMSRGQEKTNSKVSKTIEIDKKRPPDNDSRMQKRMKFKKDKEEKKNNTMYGNTLKKKAYNKEKVDEMVNRLYHNDYKYRKPSYKEEEKNKTTDAENEADIQKFIERFTKDLQKRNENLENIKKELEKNEKEKCTYKPEMSKGSQKYNKSNKDNFFVFQKNYLYFLHYIFYFLYTSLAYM